MLEFIRANAINISLVVIAIICLVLAYKKGKEEVVKKVILDLVVKAEKQLGSGTGELKYAAVIGALYSKLPTIVRFLYSEKDIDTIIEDCVVKLRGLLDDGVTLDGYK